MLKRNRFFDEIVDNQGEERLVFKMGKYRGEYLDDVVTEFAGRRYIEWLINEVDDMPEEVRDWIASSLDEYEDKVARRSGAGGLK